MLVLVPSMSEKYIKSDSNEVYPLWSLSMNKIGKVCAGNLTHARVYRGSPFSKILS